MSDEVSLPCSYREALNLLFNTDTRELMNPYQLNWMAHWSQASNSSSLPCMKPSSPTSYHMLNSSDAQGLINSNLHPMAPLNYENVTSYYLQNSDKSSSDWTHFPMFEINRRVESILSTKRGASLTHIQAEQILSLSKKSMLALKLTQSADEGHLHHQNYVSSRKTVAISMPNYKNLCSSENKLHFISSKEDSLLVSENSNNSLNSCPLEIDRECGNDKEFPFGKKKNKCLLITNEIGCGEGSKVSTNGRDKRHSFFEKLTVPKAPNKICKYTKPLDQPHGTNIDIPGTSKYHGVEGSGLQKAPQDDNLKILEIEEDSDTSRTETMNTNSKKPSNSTRETTNADSEPSSTWLKRLRSTPLDPVPLNTKRFKKGDVSSLSEMQNLLARVVNYNKSISNNVECSQADSLRGNVWIKRWCKSSANKKDAMVLCEPENSKMTNEKFDAKQLPSLAAMALMGKQVISFRPCQFQKRGPATVWKIDRIKH